MGEAEDPIEAISVEEFSARVRGLLGDWISHIARAELEEAVPTQSATKELSVTFDLRDYPRALRFEIRSESAAGE